MVYAEIELKKKVNWSTLKELPDGDKLVDAIVLVEEGLDNAELKLKQLKAGKRAIPDEKVEWSSTSSSDEHTHEQNGHSFHSDDKDVDMEEQRKAEEVEGEKEGCRARSCSWHQGTNGA